jgi:transposase
MFIRRTTTRNRTASESYFTFRLVRSDRMDGKVKQSTLLNLGRHFDVDQSLWANLCIRIEALLSGQAGLFPVDLPASVERHAQRITAQLIARQPVQPAVESGNKPASDVHSVDVNSMALIRPRSVGVEQAALWAMEQVNFQGLLEQLGFNGPQRAAALGSIIGRMAAPGSELATYGWLTTRSGLGELLDIDYEAMSLSQLYRISDRLYSSRALIATALFNRVSDLFGLSTTVTLYDLTNTYFEGEMAGNPKAQRGHSKEKRSDCPLVTLGMVLDASGFVRRSEVFAGNVSEGTTLEKMLAGLNAPADALVVMDRGIATEKNIQWLLDRGYRYLVVSRERNRCFAPERATMIENASGERLHLEKCLTEDGKEVKLYCFSEQREKKEQAINDLFSERFEEALEKIAGGLSRPRTVKNIDKLWVRIGRLKAKSHGMAQHYEIELVADEKGENAVALHWKRKPVDGSCVTHPGVYCLRSSEIDWDEEKLWRTYSMLTDMEAVFRSLKSELGMRPVYHHKEERVDGHLFITVLAYQFVQIIRHTLHSHEINTSWNGLRQSFSGQVRVTATFKQPDGHTLHVRKATLPEGDHLAVCQALKIEIQPGSIEKLIF